jgi:FKBP-type peptidyl-prolyl cis-trans isomerase SlyD
LRRNTAQKDNYLAPHPSEADKEHYQTFTYMIIDKNTVVTVHYKLQRDDAKGDLIEQTHGSQPLVFLYGAGQMIPEFERQLEGKQKGDSLQFGIGHLEAYGPIQDEAVIPMPKTTFVVDGKLAEELLVPGKIIPMADQSGNQLTGTVQEVKENEVIMDFNHPMAGVDLYFSIDVEDVRAATAEEVAHGHVHGPGGHEH